MTKIRNERPHAAPRLPSGREDSHAAPAGTGVCVPRPVRLEVPPDIQALQTTRCPGVSRNAWASGADRMLSDAWKLVAEIKAGLVDEPGDGAGLFEGVSLAKFIGFTAVPAGYAGIGPEVSRLPSYNGKRPEPYSRAPDPTLRIVRELTGQMVNAENQALVLTGAYAVMDRKPMESRRQLFTHFGAIPNLPTLVGHVVQTEAPGMSPRMASHPAPVPSPSVPRAAAGRAHDAMLHYKTAAGKRIAAACKGLDIVDVSCDHDYPCVLVGIKPGSVALPQAQPVRTRLKFPQAHIDFAELMMYVFVGIVNLRQQGLAERDRQSISLRHSFGFPAATATFIKTRFRLGVPLATPAYMEMLADALADLNRMAGDMFTPPRTAREARSLERTRQALLQNFGLDDSEGIARLKAYYQGERGATRESVEKNIATLREALNGARSWGDILNIRAEKLRGGTSVGTTIAGTVRRGTNAGSDLIDGIIRNPGESFLALESVISSLMLEKGQISYQWRGHVVPQEPRQEAAAAVHPTAAEQGTMADLEPLYNEKIQAIGQALLEGSGILRARGFPAEVTQALSSIATGLRWLSGAQLQEAWECIDSLLTAGTARKLRDDGIREGVPGPMAYGSDSENEFETETGDDPYGQTAGGVRILHRKFPAQNGMQAIVTSVLACKDNLMEPDEIFIPNDEMKKMYYEAEDVLLGMEMLEPGKRVLPLRQASHHPATAVAVALDFNPLTEDAVDDGDAAATPLSQLQASDRKVWHVDVTSTPQDKRREIIAAFGKNPHAQYMFLVSSGMKHEQLNAFNGYGTTRVFAKVDRPGARRTFDAIGDSIRKRTAPLNRAAHELRKTYMACGLVPAIGNMVPPRSISSAPAAGAASATGAPDAGPAASFSTFERDMERRVTNSGIQRPRTARRPVPVPSSFDPLAQGRPVLQMPDMSPLKSRDAATDAADLVLSLYPESGFATGDFLKPWPAKAQADAQPWQRFQIENRAGAFSMVAALRQAVFAGKMTPGSDQARHYRRFIAKYPDIAEQRSLTWESDAGRRLISVFGIVAGRALEVFLLRPRADGTWSLEKSTADASKKSAAGRPLRICLVEEQKRYALAPEDGKPAAEFDGPHYEALLYPPKA